MGSRKEVIIQGLSIGGNSPVRIESMIKTPLTDIEACAAECEALAKEGCELIRVSLPELALAKNMKELNSRSPIPIMADIHFNHKLALAALDSGCSSIRINPGNMSDKSGTVEVIKLAKEIGAVIRIGANGGSISNSQLEHTGGDRATALAYAVEQQLIILNECSFEDIIISAKSSSVRETIKANSILAQKYPFPIHIGITEAGFGTAGIIKGTAGISLMLAQGIGDTVRVSLTGPSVDEVKVGYQILGALEKRRRGYNLISCPTCGRKRIDVFKLVHEVTSLLPSDIKDGITIAVMGCEVNGPKEAASADLGIAGTPDGFVMFSRGKPVCNDTLNNLKERLLIEIERFRKTPS
ncbi:MAG: flavodoxin-dependent (E)-4-hydroxy-3-methylbut-2-enyl-diphosphate synthase [Synergistaceae bacterium]|nr:flavodoxin-dependent (E)-4-hydroxy-3-methylbut-2-enyl-diphosphate synthase [Synergistaceae bacterium]